MQIAISPSPQVVPFEALQGELVVDPNPLRSDINQAYRQDETSAVQWLLAQISDPIPARLNAQHLARQLVNKVRNTESRASGVGALMHEFTLSSEEGIALMCLAEALLRIPDTQTADRLIADKISKGDWHKHLGESPSLFVNAATWGLLLTGKLVGTRSDHGLGAALTRLIAKGGEPLIRKGVDFAMRLLGDQFVTGRTIAEALENSRDNEARGYGYSYDMLGEAALTTVDAEKYYAAYENAIHAIGRVAAGRGIKSGPGISIKLSALHPRYSRAQRARVMQELLPRLRQLALLAKHYDIGINIDAEEADRLELSLDIVASLALDDAFAGYDGIGFVVQAYQKRAPFVIDFLVDLAHRSGRRLMVRLVKGAYWDSEIKRAQVDGMPGYPVYTRKVYTDLSYLVCAQKLLAANDVIYPQFATHNALTMATIYTWALQDAIVDYEFQCLYGMGEALYDQIVGDQGQARRTHCRIYAPVGSHETLLPYLVRRLLENGANSSFVNQIHDEHISLETLIADPIETAKNLGGAPHPSIALPCDLFGNERKNSAGMDLTNEAVLRDIGTTLYSFGRQQWEAEPILCCAEIGASDAKIIPNPADHRDQAGQVIEASQNEVDAALSAAHGYARQWQNIVPSERADMLCRAADLLECHRLELIALAIREAGKTLPNSIAEVREAVDFLRYYAAQARRSGNTSALGVVACISPWNFPLAIFIGQISAALAAGNVVLAKPAEQTPLIAYRAVQLLHQAGIPRGALQFLPGQGDTVGAALVADHRVKGVIFTGSTEVAQRINCTLSRRMNDEAGDIVLIAETGGQNAMIVDSSALAEQVVQDVMTSAFDSAGQRCSALRVLCVQSDIADKILILLKGAMQELRIGQPDRLATDIGPVIDAESRRNLQQHVDKMKADAKYFYALPFNAAEGQNAGSNPESETAFGTFFAPTVIEINALSQLQHEVFGPVLHVLRYQRDALPQLIDAINASGYGLTLGIHSRIDETINFIVERARVGNIYVNRNMVGAVVGVQPFGGEGKSGTGPKAGGPLYLKRLLRDPAPSIIAAIRPPLRAHIDQRLDALTAWASLHNQACIATAVAQYRHDSLLDISFALPGPTGERNTLSFVPRGTVLCVASDIGILINQLAAVFATGNTAVVLGHPNFEVPSALQDQLYWIDDVDAITADFQIALIEPAQVNTLRPVLAARAGALVQIIETAGDCIIPLWRLVAERALCVNTTAAGGNASLMTLG